MTDVVSVDCGEAPIENVALALELLKDVDVSAYSIPNHESKIFKDECMFCYTSPYHPGGLYICLKTFTAFCEHHMREMAERRGRNVFLQLKSKKTRDETEEPREKIKRLAIGIDEGFCNEKMEVEDEYYLVIFPRLATRIPINLLSSHPIGVACDRIATTTSAERLELLQGASNAWDGEMKQVTKHVNLKQIDNPPVLPMSGWKCDVETCDLSENLWLNLTDGAIRCGRSQIIGDGVRSRGNNHMKMYYEEKHFPLVVKLGTIEESGVADVYSYDEDDAVANPNLEKHLAHFGLKMKEMKKSEKSTVELELDMNQKWEWARCQEDGENLETVFGPLHTGIVNIGSSCYINSVIQALLSIPDYVNILGKNAPVIMNDIDPCEMNESIPGQMAKLFSSLANGNFSKPPPNNEYNGVKPTQFRKVVGKGHIEFSTCRQQDAEEYLRHLIDKISTHVPIAYGDANAALRFKQQVRLVDESSGHVRYTEKEEFVLALPIPKTSLIPVDQEALRFSVPLTHCISAAFSEESIEGFTSPITGETRGARSCISMATFPDYLMIQVQRFQMGDDYQVKKMDVDVIVEDVIDLTPFRGIGVQPGEQLLPQENTEVDEKIVCELTSMGFTRNAAVKAVLNTKGQDLGGATEWIMRMMDDPTLNDPLPSQMASMNNEEVSGEEVEQLVMFGFTPHQAKYALKKEKDVNAAAEWLFNNGHSVPEESIQPVIDTPKEYRDGSGKYELVSFISHMGSSPHSGHYVCHALRSNRWILFNDEKVAVSKNPPKQLAYLYLYKRV
ncbi:usp-5 [Pristionchus pacificus]|uniref:Ubiquitin carboxyl-terminal hydrolase n=1 Tax=Pristionchus pacificus TaxID=54126 RepID=A0A2A6BDF4_PRIPA|nr:usp-5 [Pristionchus pacificus]|eukprot:PDM63888.1 usp-5 [Pristionchus pacificus]